MLISRRIILRSSDWPYDTASTTWEGSHDPDMMSEVVARFKPFEHCCMAKLFVGGRGCFRGKFFDFLGKGVIPCVFFFGTLSLGTLSVGLGDGRLLLMLHKEFGAFPKVHKS